jgi:hypothetical protein
VSYFEVRGDVPANPSVPAPAAQVTAAFARLRDAYYAVGILESGGEAPVLATVEELFDERGTVQLILLRVEVEGLGLERVHTAVAGGHGVAIPPREPGNVVKDVRTARLA